MQDFGSLVDLCLATGWTTGRSRFDPMGTGGPFPGAKARSGRDADHSPATNAEVVNE
jgi:hypothetical protein